jgi:ATP-dependent Clp protease ATP-binding subunit ClpA
MNDFADLSDMSKTIPRASGHQAGNAPASSASTNALYRFCIDKTARAKEGKIDPIIGRDKEVRMIAEILGRRTKPNVIITGEPGVGKTALVDGFALNIAKGDVPKNLANALIFELDLGSLVAGASYKGEVEDRLKSIIKEIKQFEKAILFIDELHVLMDKNGGAAGAVQLLKPEMARGEITIIGATTFDEYRKHIEKDEAFSRRFELIKVEEPDERTAAKMLETIVSFYEKHHQLTVSKDAIPEGIRLAKRYDKDRRLPDSSIDLLDRTMASIRMMGDNAKEEIKQLAQKLDEIHNAFSKEEDAIYLKELKWFYTQLQNKVSHILLNKVEETNGIDKIEYPIVLHEKIALVLNKLGDLAEEKKETVDKSDLMATISFKTGIPIGKVQVQERERLLKMEEFLRNWVVGKIRPLRPWQRPF